MFVLTLRKISLDLQIKFCIFERNQFLFTKTVFQKTEPRYSRKNQVVKGCQIVFRPKKNPSLNYPALHTFANLGCLQVSSANRKPAYLQTYIKIVRLEDLPQKCQFSDFQTFFVISICDLSTLLT
jgi:hypothetical protein